jgi:penicillin-binding protein 3
LKFRKWFVLMFFPLLFLINGCEKEIKPEESFKTYVSNWIKMDYAGMYDQLSEDSKKAMTKDAFIKRYNAIYKGIQTKQLNVSFDPPNATTASHSADKVEMTYHVNMTTVAGPITFDHKVTLVKENVDKQTRWNVSWDPSLIFPQLNQGDKVQVQVTKAQRGEINDRNAIGLAVNGPVSKRDSHPGKNFRRYPLGEAAAHLTGYVGTINAQELEKWKDKGYQMGDIVGKSGLEQVFEDQLRGKDGVRIYIVDEKGAEKQTIIKVDPVAGQTVTTTIDSTIQKAMFEQLKPDAATASAIQPISGDILALVSSPSYDPNQMVEGVTKEQWNKWNNDPQKPLLNRFTKAFVPGSAYKVITAAIGLNTHTLDPQKERNIDGLHWTKDASWGNYYVTRVHAAENVNLQKALVFSDNIYFAQAALDIGKERLTKEATNFGMGEKLPLPYPFEISTLSNKGIVNEIQLADSGYGQGEVTMTALHVALAYTPLVNEGKIPYPALILNEKNHPKIWKENVMASETVREIKNDLIKAVNSPEGTGHKAAIPDITIAGKTGTAELKKAKGEDGVEYGWFVGFNVDHPQLLISMMVEDVKNRGGSGYVASKVRNIFQKFIK